MTSRSPVHGDFIAHPPWTARQRQVLDLLAHGRTNPEIADELGISLDGAKWHVREIIGTLGVDSREEAADHWRAENGLARRLFRGLAGTFGMFAGPAGWVAGGLVATGVAAIVVLAIVVATRGSNPPPALAPAPSATATASQPTATATAQGTPEATPTRPPGAIPAVSGVQIVDKVIDAVTRNDSVSLVALIRGMDVACAAPDMFVGAPACPDGAAIGTMVPSVVSFQCEGGWVPLAVLDPPFNLINGPDELNSVTNGGAPALPGDVPDHWILFDNSTPAMPPGFAVAVKDGAVVSFGNSCGDSASLRTRLLVGAAGYLVPPKG